MKWSYQKLILWWALVLRRSDDHRKLITDQFGIGDHHHPGTLITITPES